jgi:stearoyl-CoA desaturase (delta-9 desaturase)
VYDYVKAKEREDVLKVKNRIPVNAYEAYIERHPMLGPSALMIGLILLFGALWGTILAVSCYLISPLFAVGGVNALAHFIGYQNHFSRDNSRNLGFLFPLNFAICGELDHNNHHAYQRSCSFRHRWFEFDIGYFYIKLMSKIGLAKIVNTYNPELKRKKIMEQVRSLLEHDFRFQKKIEDLSKELNTSYADLAQKVEAYLEGQKVKLDRPIRKIAQEIKRTAKINVKLQLSY